MKSANLIRLDSLVSPELHRRLTSQLIREHAAMTGDRAVRIVDATVAFLKVCADNPDAYFRPSQEVDKGWHQFILNTVDYEKFCQRIAGRFLHHAPDEFTPPRADRADTVASLAPTVAALSEAGFDVDPDLWTTGSSDCTQCHSGCTNCGQGDGPSC